MNDGQTRLWTLVEVLRIRKCIPQDLYKQNLQQFY
jgi:hypothetical protein